MIIIVDNVEIVSDQILKTNLIDPLKRDLLYMVFVTYVTCAVN